MVVREGRFFVDNSVIGGNADVLTEPPLINPYDRVGVGRRAIRTLANNTRVIASNLNEVQDQATRVLRAVGVVGGIAVGGVGAIAGLGVSTIKKIKSTTIFDYSSSSSSLGSGDDQDPFSADHVVSPMVEILIFSVKKSIKGKGRILDMKLYIKNNFVEYFHEATVNPKLKRLKPNRFNIATDQIIQNLPDMAVLGVEVENSGVHGSKFELSISEYYNWLWSRVESGDFILIRTGYTHDRYMFTLPEYVNKVVKSEKGLVQASAEIDFAGFITLKKKSVGSTEQLRVEGSDFLKILQQMNVSLNEEIVLDSFGNSYLQNDLVNIFLSKLLDDLARSYDVGEASERKKTKSLGGKYKDSFRTEPEKFFRWLKQNDKYQHREFWDRPFFTEFTFDSDDDPRKGASGWEEWNSNVSIVNVVFTPIYFAESVIRYALEEMGILDYFDIVFVSEPIRELYQAQIKETIMKVGRKVRTPFIYAELAFARNVTVREDGDGEAEKVFSMLNLSDEELKTSLVMTTFNLPLYAGFNKEIGVHREKYYVHSPQALANIPSVIDNMSFDAMKRVHIKKHAPIMKKIRERYFFNNFIDVVSSSSVETRADPHVDREGGTGGNKVSSIPLTNLIYYSYGYFNPTTVYDNTWRNKFEENKIGAFKSYGYMQSLAQNTWIQSSFFRDRMGRFCISIMPMCTQILYENVNRLSRGFRKKGKWKTGKQIYMNTNELLEWEFQQIKMNRKILFIRDNYKSSAISSDSDGEREALEKDTVNMEYIRLEEEGGKRKEDFLKNAYFDILGEQSIDINDYKTEMNSMVFDNLKIATYSLESEIDDVVDQYSSIWYPYIYSQVVDPQVRAFDDGDLTYDNLTQWYQWDTRLPVASGTLTLSDNTITPEDVVFSNGDYGYLSANIPFEFTAAKRWKNGRFQGRENYLIAPDVDPDGKTYETHVFDDASSWLKVYSSWVIDGSDIEEPYVSNMYIGNIKSVINLDTLKQSLEFLFLNKLLPDDLLEKIKVRFLPLDLEDGDNKYRVKVGYSFLSLGAYEYSITELILYLKKIIREIEKDSGTNILPFDVDLIANPQDIWKGLEGIMKSWNSTIRTVVDEADLFSEESLDLSSKPREFVTRKELIDAFSTIISVSNIPFDPLIGDDGGVFDEFGEIDVMKERMDEISELPFFVKTRTSLHRYFNIYDQPYKSFARFRAGLQEIVKWIYVYDKYVKNILRKNYDVGDLYMPNKGKDKIEVGQLISLIHGKRNATDLYLTAHPLAFTQIARGDFGRAKIQEAIQKTTLFVEGMGRKEIAEVKFDSDVFDSPFTKNAVYSLTEDFTDVLKPFGWYAWKVKTYLGDASGGGTSGFTQKIYLARDGVMWRTMHDESDWISDFSKSLNESGYNIIIPRMIGT